MTHSPLPPFAATSGPRNARIFIIGQSWGQSEEAARKPFVGASGQLLFEMLGEAMPTVAPELHQEIREQFKWGSAWVKRRGEWLEEASIFMTNVLALRPPDNKIEFLCGGKKDVEAERKPYLLPSISQGKYLRWEFLPELDRLFVELDTVRPNLILALGNEAIWATLRVTSIGTVRGAVAKTPPLGPSQSSYKILSTYHPAGVLRSWSWKSIVVADLMKASREAKFPEIRRPRRKVVYNPTLQELREWVAETLNNPPVELAADTETAAGQITHISFARSVDDSICIPFVDMTKAGNSYWQTEGEELVAWDLVEQLLRSPITKVWQNYMYDIQYVTPMAICPGGGQEDTMLLHHSMYPEMQKGLGFLGSIYTDESSWKLMRRHRPDTEKRDE